MLRRCAETFKTTFEISKPKLVLMHALCAGVSFDSFNSELGGLLFNKSVNKAKGTIMPGPGPKDFIFQPPLKPEGGPEGDIPKMSFPSVNCICPKYPKTDVKISITLGTLAAGVQFPASS